MRERIDEVELKEFQVVVIAPSSASFIAQFLEHFGPFPFDIYGDPSRQLYKEQGTVTMQKWKLLSKALWGAVTGKVKNFLPNDENQKEFVKNSMKTQDVYIQGGTWLYDENGQVIWHHIDSSPEDHAKLDTVLQYMEKHNSKE
ncbi:peroxiredoxin-like family protein [Pontibacillus sp. HMF3514]|uniref:peroxiredoxin-like family protein n=1 Tax=Pontibacillus sp. HMF3514 TaxID=2692425 RepID=UPI00132011B5|nr:hypothetical protein GS400_18770 [Pontibacillus sp. HMF3514]